MPAPATPYRPYGEAHDAHQQEGADKDARPTALQIIDDEKLVGKLQGKTFLVTGCSAGIGIETARALHATGANVFMTVREGKKAVGEKVIQDILATSPGKGKLELVFLDLSSFKSVRSGAADLLRRAPTLNVLVLNAGVMSPSRIMTEDGWESQIGTNHFGHFLLFQLLKDRLLESATQQFSSRVVVTTSFGHVRSKIRFDDLNFEHGEYNSFEGYGQSKTANIYMANSIERHYGAKNLHATSVHPGVILDTELSRDMAPDYLNSRFDMTALKKINKSVSQGAASQVWAATAKYFNDKGGVYLADCEVCGPVVMGNLPGVAGYAPHAYDEESEEKFWRLSCDAAGVSYD